ncbi:MAG: heparinase II/III-family protein [Bacteroidales bacterium]|nr:heparinase II/III-family protein [Bacteroidales bacterium]
MKLSSSGFRRFFNSYYECLIDIGPIGCNYQPGHSHADTFTFDLHAKGVPFIVNHGITTYEKNNQRQLERSTPAHNTVSLDQNNSSIVWGGFRVAQRANVEVKLAIENQIIAQHDGYKRFGIIHQRNWTFEPDYINIEDEIIGYNEVGIAHFWLARDLIPVKDNNRIITNIGYFHFEGSKSMDIINKEVPYGFNKFTKCYKLEIKFQNKLTSKIYIN